MVEQQAPMAPTCIILVLVMCYTLEVDYLLSHLTQHTISTDYTGISLQTSGSHTHTINGTTGSVGLGQPINIMPPYQIVHYIIRA